MKKIFILLLIILISCDKDGTEQQWKKGNLHTHSFWSDGDDFPEMIIDWYKTNNYDGFTIINLLHYQITIQLQIIFIGTN